MDEWESVRVGLEAINRTCQHSGAFPLLWQRSALPDGIPLEGNAYRFHKPAFYFEVQQNLSTIRNPRSRNTKPVTGRWQILRCGAARSFSHSQIPYSSNT